MTLSFRPVQAADIPAICGFAQSADEAFFFFPKCTWPVTPEQLAAAIAQRSDSSVVVEGDEVLAFANFYQWEQGGVCSLGNVLVSPAARGRGVARFLVEQMIEVARQRHQAREMKVSCFNHNTAGLLLYPQLGFLPFGIEERQDHAGRRVALVQMRQAL
ncbi:GNAT family N-acetyltransferase [Pseudomonas japonica]|uniref:Ribosomal protein S18 acetylase RimI n=1 Tax=Pseudomonas japonica TaxID=256466 RepID=A0A239BTX0_9PSED|nr:GNAT family N-acetyltransferase [Pseudomonas japonica]SNS11350.1 Ribosomal protein S18 acetylase RimI [Pseudomonas japonica]